MSQFLFCVALTIFFSAILVVIAYYSWKMAEELIVKREKIVSRVKKTLALNPMAKSGLRTVKKAQVK
jgi:hypothetical protein